MQFDGHIHIGEGARWAQRACARLNGNPAINLLAGCLLGGGAGWLGAVAASFAVEDLGVPGWAYLPVFLLIAGPLWVVTIRLLRTWMVARYRRKLIDRGVENPLSWSLSVTPDALHTRLGDVETRAPWATVTEIFPVGPYWVLLIQGSASFVPKRNLGDATQEQAFVAEVLERLSPAAQARSTDAARFARATTAAA